MPGPWSLGVRAGAAAGVGVRSASLSAPDFSPPLRAGVGVDVRLGPSLSVVELVHTVYLRACGLACDRLNKPPGFCIQTLYALGEVS